VAHRICNLNRRRQLSKISLLFHNFSGYDSHIIVKGLARLSAQGKKLQKKKLTGLVHNKEKFRTLDYGSFRLIDSNAFFNSSLDKMCADMVESEHDFPILKSSGIADRNDSKLELLHCKGFFPYTNLTSYDEYKNIIALPAKDAFKNDLTGKNISNIEYEHALRVYREFNLSNMQEYLLLYNQTDVFILAEAIVLFRTEIFTEFGLDMCQYLSLSQLAFDCYLNYTKTELEVMSDLDSILKIEASLRGGISYVKDRYVQCTDEEQLVLVDAVNLYGKFSIYF
jgi:hypothetical protein